MHKNKQKLRIHNKTTMAKSKRLTIKEQEAERYHYETVIKSLHRRIRFNSTVYMIALIVNAILYLIFMHVAK